MSNNSIQQKRYKDKSVMSLNSHGRVLHWGQPCPGLRPLATFELSDQGTQFANLRLLHLNQAGIVRGLDLCQVCGGNNRLGAGNGSLVVKTLLARNLDCGLKVMCLVPGLLELCTQVIDLFQQGNIVL